MLRMTGFSRFVSNASQASCRGVVRRTQPRAGIRASPLEPGKAVLCLMLRMTGFSRFVSNASQASCRGVVRRTQPRAGIPASPLEPGKAVLCLMLRMTGSRPRSSAG